MRLVSSENKLQKQFDSCVHRLTGTRKRYEDKIQDVQKKLKDFSGKFTMSEAETYVKELEDIQTTLDELNLEVLSSIRSLLVASESRLIAVLHVVTETENRSRGIPAQRRVSAVRVCAGRVGGDEGAV